MTVPVVLAPAVQAADQQPFWVLLTATVFLLVVAVTGFVLWRYAERDMVDARTDADHWRAQHQQVTADLVQARGEAQALRQQLGEHLLVQAAWADEDRPDSLPTLLREPTAAVPVLDATARLWTGGQATVHVQPDPATVVQAAQVVEPADEDGWPTVEQLSQQVAAASVSVQPDAALEPMPALPAGLTAQQAAAAARWHRGGKTWAEVGDLLGVSATTAAKAARAAG